MKLPVYLAGLFGLSVATGLIAWQGFAVMFEALAVAGWGLVVVALFHFIPQLADNLGWRLLVLPSPRPSLYSLTWIRWIREAVDALLPVAQIGGKLVGIRLLMLHRISGAAAGSSVVVELTLSVITQLLFTLIGLGLLLLLTRNNAVSFGVLAGVAVGSVGVVGFIFVQRRGLFATLLKWLSAMTGGERWISLVGGAARLDEAIQLLYRRRATLFYSGVWQFLAWMLGTGEVWLALYFLGHPVSIMEALFLESLGQAIRSAGFSIPGSLGVQEGGYMVLGTVLGLSPETGLALSLAKRVRELLLGIPALITWQWLEGRRFWSSRGEQTRTDTAPIE